MTRKLLVGTGVFLACLSLCGCRERQSPRAVWKVMGTVASVAVPGESLESLTNCASHVELTFSELESLLSTYRRDSEVSRLNQQAGGDPLPVSIHTREVLQLSRKYADLSGGGFDITVAPLVQLWGFSGGAPRSTLPPDTELHQALALVGNAHLAVTDESARLDREGMRVDLGGIAKGYAVDVACAALAKQGTAHAMVNLGGNIRVLGEAAPGRPWRIGVRNPFARNGLLGSIPLPPGSATATSGNYERFVMIDGQRYAHVVDPRTGKPVAGMAGVTVVAPTAVEADALSTALFVVGVEGAKALLARVPGVDALLVPDEKPIRILVSPGMAKRFKPMRGHTVEPLP